MPLKVLIVERWLVLGGWKVHPLGKSVWGAVCIGDTSGGGCSL